MLRRVEMTANLSLQEDVMEKLEKLELSGAFSTIEPVHGNGSSGPCFGSAVWPEENFYLLMFLPESQIEPVRRIVRTIRTRHPGVGLACFISDGQVERV